MKVMETVNVVIDESSESGFDKFGEEIPKEILPLEPKEVTLRKCTVDKCVANFVSYSC